MTQIDQKGRLLTKENHTRSWGTYNCCTHEANEGEEVTGIEDGGGGGGGGNQEKKAKKAKKHERREKRENRPHGGESNMGSRLVYQNRLEGLATPFAIPFLYSTR